MSQTLPGGTAILHAMRAVKHSRWIAACLMVAMVSWVESLALPAADSQHVPHQNRVAGHQHPMEHPCCPRASLPMPSQPAQQAPGSDLHRCCFLRAPQAPPPGNQKNEAPPSTATEEVPLTMAGALVLFAGAPVACPSAEAVFRWVSDTNMVLRI